jgi:hypothetical protein
VPQNVELPDSLVTRLLATDPLQRKKVGPRVRELLYTDPRADPNLAAPLPVVVVPAKKDAPAPGTVEHVIQQGRKNEGSGNWGVSPDKLAQLDADLELGRVVRLRLITVMGDDAYVIDYAKVKDMLIRRWVPETFWLLKADDLYAAGHPGVVWC